jgi:hypothetical protein
MDFGATAGLAYRHNWQAVIQQQQQNELLDRQAELDAKNEAMMLGDKLKFAHASNAWDNKLLKEFSEQRIAEVGQFVLKSGGWQNVRTSAPRWAEFNRMTDELVNNDILYRSLRIQDNHKALIDYLRKNPGAENDPDIQVQLQEYNNYVNNGSVDGITANAKEFVFRSPDSQFDAQKAIAEAYINLKGKETYDPRGVGIGATKTAVDPVALQSTAIGLLNGPNGWRFKRAWEAMSPEQQSFYGNDPVKWVSTAGSAYTVQEVKAGAIFKPESSGGSGRGSGGGGQAGAYSPFYNDFGRLAPGQSTYSNHVKSLLPIKDGKMRVDGDLRVPVVGADGKMGWNIIKGYAGMQVDAYETGRVVMGPSGEFMAEVQVKAPIQKELMYGDNPMLKSTSFFEWTYDAGQEEEVDAYKGVVRLEKKDGANTGNVFITTYVPAAVTQSSVREYDQQASGQLMANKVEGAALSTLNTQALNARAAELGGQGVGELNGQYVTVVNGQAVSLTTGKPVQ